MLPNAQNARRSDLRLEHESATDLSSDEHQVATSPIKQRSKDVLNLSQQRSKDVLNVSQQRPKDVLLFPTPPSVTGSSQNVTPRGATAILASQIDQVLNTSPAPVLTWSGKVKFIGKFGFYSPNLKRWDMT